MVLTHVDCIDGTASGIQLDKLHKLPQDRGVDDAGPSLDSELGQAQVGVESLLTQRTKAVRTVKSMIARN